MQEDKWYGDEEFNFSVATPQDVKKSSISKTEKSFGLKGKPFDAKGVHPSSTTIYYVPTHAPKDRLKSSDSIQNLTSPQKTFDAKNGTGATKKQCKVQPGESLKNNNRSQTCSLTALNDIKISGTRENTLNYNGKNDYSNQKEKECVKLPSAERSPSYNEISKPLKTYRTAKKDDSDSDFEPGQTKKILNTNEKRYNDITCKSKRKRKSPSYDNNHTKPSVNIEGPIDLCDDDDDEEDDDDIMNTIEEMDSSVHTVGDTIHHNHSHHNHNNNKEENQKYPLNIYPIRNLILMSNNNNANEKQENNISFPFHPSPPFGYLPSPIYSPIIFIGKKKFFSKKEKCEILLSPYDKYLKVVLEDESLKDLDLIKKKCLDYEKISFSHIDKIM